MADRPYSYSLKQESTSLQSRLMGDKIIDNSWQGWSQREMVVSLSRGVLELRTATGSEAFSLLVCLGANKFVWLSSAGSRPWHRGVCGGEGGGGGRSSRALDKWGARSPKIFFSALWASVCSKNWGGAGPPGPSPGPPLLSVFTLA